MRSSPILIGRYSSLVVAVALLAHGDLTAEGGMAATHLTITADLQPSISLVFDNSPSVGSPGFCPLSNAGTNNVGLDLGAASYTGGDTLSCVSWSQLWGNFYQVSSAFEVVVSAANTNSPNYQLAAEISTAPPANVFWLVNYTPLTNTGFTTLDASDSYGTPVTKTLQVLVGGQVAAQTLSETITFLATAN